MKIKYPIYTPWLGGNEKKYVMDCMESTWISSQGKYIDMFESKVSDYTGASNCISVFNGTVALHLVLAAYDIGPGDEVVVPDFTYIASPNSILYTGATPVLCDVDLDTWNATDKTIEPCITSKTKAILVTDIYGVPNDLNPILELADKHNLVVICDSAESFGAKYKGKFTGNLGVPCTFSFFGNKTITTGEGGMVCCNDDKMNVKMRILKNQGNSPTKRYFHDLMGFNFRMTNIQAAIGTAQMENIEFIIEQKKQIYNRYKSNLKEFVTFQKVPDYIEPSYWMTGFTFKDESQKDMVREALKEDGIDTRPFFFPAHQMPYMKNVDNKVTVDISKRGVNVPSYPALSMDDVDFISEKIIKNI